MAGWASKYNQKMNDMLMGALPSQKPISMDLMQNCDLPPPLKVFSRSDKTVLSSMNRVFSLTGKQETEDDEVGGCRGDDDGENEKVELLKALRLSQTRAREAERKANSLAKERDAVSKAFLEESLKGLAYCHWVRLLEAQVIHLRQQIWRLQQEYSSSKCGCGRSSDIILAKELQRDRKNHCEDDGNGGVPWIVASAFCLGFAGVGLAFVCRYLL